MKCFWLLILTLMLANPECIWSQEKSVSGIVYDMDSKYRLSKVYVYNTRSEIGVMNNQLGAFEIDVLPNDILIAASEGFSADTIRYTTQNALLFKLKSFGIRLKPVTVKGIRKTPKDQYQEKLEEYRNTIRSANTNLLDGATSGINVDILYNLISKRGKNARILQQVLEHNYHDAIIDYKFTKEYVKSITKIQSDTILNDFMFQYRPSYFFILNASDYDLAAYVKMCYSSYKQTPTKGLPPDLPQVVLPKP